MIPLVPVAALLVALTAASAVALPLLVYTTSLAALGLAHVASELRYVRLRFGHALHSRVALSIAALLAGVVVLRLARLTDAIAGPLATRLELALVALLVAAPLPLLVKSGALSALAGAAACAALAAGLWISPIHTLLLLAVLHNWTPLGFLWDALEPEQRRRFMPAALLVFIGLPLLIATGAPFRALAHIPGVIQPELTILPAGELSAHLGAYLPGAWHAEPWALHAFSAIVFAQCMHYAAVLHVMPRLLPPAERAPARPALALFIAVAALLFVGFTQDFARARQLYGVAAAVHAWIELPLLLVALSAPTLIAAKERPCHAPA